MMKDELGFQMKAVNAATKKELASNVILADSLFKRMKGLLGRRRLEKGEALLIKPCKGIHTIGMRFPIDVLFMDSGNIVVALRKDLPPNRMTRFYLHAVSALELPSGALSLTGTAVGDSIEID